MGNNTSTPAPAPSLTDTQTKTQDSPLAIPPPPVTVTQEAAAVAPVVPEQPKPPEVAPELANNPGTYEELHKACKGLCHIFDKTEN